MWREPEHGIPCASLLFGNALLGCLFTFFFFFSLSFVPIVIDDNDSPVFASEIC